MILSTTSHLENHRIKKYLGILSGEAVVSKAFLSEILGGTNLLGGRSPGQETKLADAREFALEDLKYKAQRLKADAVLGIDLDMFNLNGAAVCVATGTAVWLEPTSTDSASPRRRSLHDY